MPQCTHLPSSTELPGHTQALRPNRSHRPKSNSLRLPSNWGKTTTYRQKVNQTPSPAPQPGFNPNPSIGQGSLRTRGVGGSLWLPHGTSKNQGCMPTAPQESGRITLPTPQNQAWPKLRRGRSDGQVHVTSVCPRPSMHHVTATTGRRGTILKHWDVGCSLASRQFAWSVKMRGPYKRWFSCWFPFKPTRNGQPLKKHTYLCLICLLRRSPRRGEANKT